MPHSVYYYVTVLLYLGFIRLILPNAITSVFNLKILFTEMAKINFWLVYYARKLFFDLAAILS